MRATATINNGRQQHPGKGLTSRRAKEGKVHIKVIE
jgi:hypothetical protein